MIQDLNTDNNSCAAWIAKFLINRKVEFVFGLQGGHIQPIWDHCYKLGIKIIDVRDEKAAVHMAQAYSYFTGKVGIAMVTAGPGVTNTVTGIANAFLSNIPVLLIGGCAPLPQNNMGPLQDIPHVDILKPVTNYSRTARVPDQVIRELDLAFSYAIGNKQFKLTYEQIIERFQKDFRDVLDNYNENKHTSPIDELIKFKEERFQSFKNEKDQEKQNKLQNEQEENQLMKLNNSEFLNAIKKITQSTIEQKQYSAKLQQKVNEKKLYNEINSFINKVESMYKNKMLLIAKEGKNKIAFSFIEIQNSYLLNHYSENQIQEVLEDEFIVNRLEKVFLGFNYQINIIKQSYHPFNLILQIEW